MDLKRQKQNRRGAASTFIFFVATKRGFSIKPEAKENLALRWACLTRYCGNINSEKSIRRPCNISLVLDEALENLYYSDKSKMECSYANPY